MSRGMNENHGACVSMDVRIRESLNDRWAKTEDREQIKEHDCKIESSPPEVLNGKEGSH